MTLSKAWIPEGVNPDIPSMARSYDYLLGGAHNFAVDRQVVEEVIAAMPEAREIAMITRAFLRRTVLSMVSAGVRQFLDIGSGIPTIGNVHELAQGADPEARVVYVDVDPVAVAHSNVILEGNDRVAAIQADLAEPDFILDHPRTRQLLNFTQPIGLVMIGVLPFVPDESQPYQVMARYRAALAPDSYLAITHFTADVRPTEAKAVVEIARKRNTDTNPRSREQVVRFFDGFELLEPGVVSAALWRPDSRTEFAGRPARDQVLGGLGRRL